METLSCTVVNGSGVHDDCRTARVARAVFLGSFTRATLDVDGQVLTIELPGRRDELVPGRDVAIRIPPAALLHLDDEGA